jgi:hypothetical protein
MSSGSQSVQDAYNFVYENFKRLQNYGRVERRKWYASPGFTKEVESIGAAIRAIGVPKELLSNLINSAMEMRTLSQQMSPGEMNWYAQLDRMPASSPDNNDSFFMYYEAIIQQLNEGMNKVIGEDILRRIDTDFAQPIERLTETIPDELKTSKEYLLGAVDSFRKGNKEEAAVRTRKAWESSVSFALGKLPKKDGLTSLEKKSLYVLEQLGLKDESKSIAKIKNLYEGRFLHALESADKLSEPELPFYITLTAGFVHLVSRFLS